jgi:hypothetical protein
VSGGPRSSTHQGNVKGERDRWARILDHWDDRLHEHDIDEKPFPVDDPIVPANQ